MKIPADVVQFSEPLIQGLDRPMTVSEVECIGSGLARVLAYANPHTVMQRTDSSDSTIADRACRNFIDAVCNNSQKPGTQSGENGYDLLSEFLGRLGLDPYGVYNDWTHNFIAHPDRLRRSVSANMIAAARVELLQPGGTKLLNAEFGTTIFGRLRPQDALSMLAQQTKQPGKDYIQVTMSTKDPNHALMNPSVWRHFIGQLSRRDIGCRIDQIQKPEDFYTIGTDTKSRYRQYGARVLGTILAGHGNPTSISLGTYDDERGESLERHHFSQHRAPYSTEAMTTNADFLLYSCGTHGEPRTIDKTTIAEAIALNLGRTVKAYTNSVAPIAIRAYRQRDGIRFEPDFRRAGTKVKTLHGPGGFIRSRYNVKQKPVAIRGAKLREQTPGPHDVPILGFTYSPRLF